MLTLYNILDVSCAVGTFCAFFGFIMFFVAALDGSDLLAAIMLIVGIVGIVLAILTGIPLIIIDCCSTDYVTETVEMSVVDIEYGDNSSEVEVKYPNSNSGFKISTDSEAPTVNVGDTVDVKIRKEIHTIKKTEKLIESSAKIISVKEKGEN